MSSRGIGVVGARRLEHVSHRELVGSIRYARGVGTVVCLDSVGDGDVPQLVDISYGIESFEETSLQTTATTRIQHWDSGARCKISSLLRKPYWLLPSLFNVKTPHYST